MRCSQLTQWVILVSLAACTSDPVRPASGFGPGTQATGTGGDGGSPIPSTDAMTTIEDSANGAGGASAAGGSIQDAATDSTGAVRADVFVMQEDAGAAQCPNDQATLGSGTLTAAGATPPAFAAAFNAELLKLSIPGPFFMVFSGVNQGSSAPKTVSLGALAVTANGVAFAGAHVDVPFSMGPSGAVKIAMTDANFDLRFVAPASDAMIPVASVELSGTLGNACVSLTVSSMTLLVPATAGAIAFHGSTVGALMGTPTAGVQGGSNNAWPLEIAGKVKQVYAAVSDDAGDGPS